MYLQNKITAVITFLFFSWILYTGLEFDAPASYMPVFVASLGMICSALLFVTVCYKQLKGQKIEFARLFPKKETLQIIAAFILVSLYCLLITTFGFVVSSFVFFVLFALCFGDKKKILSYIIFSAVVVGIIYFGFSMTLHTNFPRGFLI